MLLGGVTLDEGHILLDDETISCPDTRLRAECHTPDQTVLVVSHPQPNRAVARMADND